MELNAKVPHEVGVLESLEYFQLVGGLFDGFVVVGLESDLMERNIQSCLSFLPLCCSVHLGCAINLISIMISVFFVNNFLRGHFKVLCYKAFFCREMLNASCFQTPKIIVSIIAIPILTKIIVTHLFHGHQLARVHIDAGVHLPVLPLTFKRK